MQNQYTLERMRLSVYWYNRLTLCHMQAPATAHPVTSFWTSFAVVMQMELPNGAPQSTFWNLILYFIGLSQLPKPNC